MRLATRNLKNELLWSSSAMRTAKSRIRTADFGQTNLGRLKGLYRSGLAKIRYEMQTICAIHYNFSFNELFGIGLNKRKLKRIDKTIQITRYFDLMRNFRRYTWLLTYLLVTPWQPAPLYKN